MIEPIYALDVVFWMSVVYFTIIFFQTLFMRSPKAGGDTKATLSAQSAAVWLALGDD